jgi:DNA-binding GntR family transcriptional regulator
VYIREISDAEAVELYDVRAGLDEMAGRRLAPIVTDAHLTELEGMLTALEASSLHGEVNNYFTLNIAFHDRLVEMAGNAVMLGLYRQVINRMHLLRRRGFSIAGSSQASHHEHRLILAALRSRDPDAVAQAMRQHVHAGFQRATSAGDASDAGEFLPGSSNHPGQIADGTH